MELRNEQTLVLVKPDGLQRGLAGEIIKRFEARGLKIVGLKMVSPSEAHIKKHYLSTKEQLEGMGNKSLENLKNLGLDAMKILGTDSPMEIGKMINNWNFQFLSSGPVLAAVFQGPHAVEMTRKIVGNTLPFKAELGTIRGDFSVDSATLGNLRKRPIRNIVHASGTVLEAQREIKHWFKKQELFDYKRVDEDLMF
ncbi:nucleoside-diphosphate kinase [Candidatus Parcubacteria bacterium]|nr:nucleoside-diphosphate kinase [Candidatus Parcubacteria bacterium]